MPCCCQTNVKAAFGLGIVFIFLNIVIFIEGFIFPKYLAIGTVGALSAGFLIYGACRHKSTPILIWMVLAIIECIIFFVLGVMQIIEMTTENVQV